MRWTELSLAEVGTALPPGAGAVEGMRLWWAFNMPFQYVVSHDVKYGIHGASAKRLVSTRPPALGPRIDLGYEFKTLDEAKRACEQHWQRTRGG